MRSVSQTVRVDIHKLDELMNVVGKLAVLRGGLTELTENARSEGHRRLGSQLGQLAHKFERSLRELQSGILEVRMVPLAQVFERLTRIDVTRCFCARTMSCRRFTCSSLRLICSAAELFISVRRCDSRS